MSSQNTDKIWESIINGMLTFGSVYEDTLWFDDKIYPLNLLESLTLIDKKELEQLRANQK